MCGIAGIMTDDADAPIARIELERMIAALRSRGPDGTGYFQNAGIGLGHARLSIIDLATGAQPLANEDRTIWVSFNGEIFNYIELRLELTRRGHVFATRSDTEVIVHAYETWGDDFPQHLNGQFAIALWDGRQRRLLLIRDRAGILPLYFSRRDLRGQKDWIFASEIKSLLSITHKRPQLRSVALEQLFTFWTPVSPGTLFEGIEEVGPGEMVVIARGEARRRSWWSWTYPESDDYRQDSSEDLAVELRELLLDAVRIRLRADVPVGAYLSGGLDSSAIAALIRASGHPALTTFSLTFDDPGLDESAHQTVVRDHIGSAHHALHCTATDIVDAFRQTIARTEMPILRSAPVPMMLLSRAVRDAGQKVVLTGEGADEVLGGYDLFKETKIRRFWAREPASAWRPRLLERLYPYLELGQASGAASLKPFFGQGIDAPDAWHFSHQPRWQTTGLLRDFLRREHRSDDGASVLPALERTLPEAFGRWHPFNRAQYLEARTLMSGYLLSSQGDRMLMANSVEGRFPFLDHRIIEFAARLHPRLKMRGLNEKFLLKEALQHDLPASVRNRHKQPYRAPDIQAFFASGQLPEWVESELSSDAVRDAGIFHGDPVALLLRKIRRRQTGSARENMAFLGILSTQIWWRQFIRSAPETGHLGLP